MRISLVALVVTSTACSKPNNEPANTITWSNFDRARPLSLTPEGDMRTNEVVGHYDAKVDELVIGDIHQALGDVVRISGDKVDLDLPFGRFNAQFRGSDVSIDGRAIAHVDGATHSPRDVKRVAVLIVANFVVPAAQPNPPPDAAEAVEPPPPPPPPPPRP